MNLVRHCFVVLVLIIGLEINFVFSELELNWVEEIEPNFTVPPGAEFSSTINHNGVVVCRLNMASLQRKENRFILLDFDGSLCTHLVYSWIYINKSYKIIRNEHFNDEMKKAKDLVTKFPHLKILLEISISHIKDVKEKVEFMNTLTNSAMERSKFIGNMNYTLTLLRRLGFAGLHLETAFYFYSNKQNFVSFAQELKDVFRQEDFLITTEIEAHSKLRISNNYNGTIGEISKVFDLIFVRGFGFHIDIEPPITGHNAPLYTSGVNQNNIYDNLKYIIDEEKADANSLVLGVPLYGRAYLLKMTENKNPFGLNEEIYTDALPLRTFNLKTVLGYNEICATALSHGEPWKMAWDNKAKTPFMRQSNRWISFDNPQSVYEKVTTANDLGLRGVMAFYIDYDDGRSRCSNITYPILRTINYALSGAKLQSYKMENPTVALATWGWISAAAIVLVILIVAFAYKIGRKMKKDRFNGNELMTFMRGTPAPPGSSAQSETEMYYINPDSLAYDSAYEIPSTNYQIDKSNIISGLFGKECSGQVNNLPATIKNAKITSSKVYIKSQLAELKLLIFLEKHENIVSLIGANTMDLNKGIVYTFLEPSPLGNLQNYLKFSSNSFISLVTEDTFSNKLTIPKEKNYKISSANLVLWSHQISSALEHLSRSKVIHGDLSAKNVSLFRKDLAKVTNIGLCQKYRELNLSKEKEPIFWRWMSIESLKDQMFSTSSDVWSFGVTLWEIFSLGEIPYSDLSWMAQFPEMLKQNLRMPQPLHATSSLYNIMLECWKMNPSERPKPEYLASYFAKLRQDSLFQNSHLLLEENKADVDESTV